MMNLIKVVSVDGIDHAYETIIFYGNGDVACVHAEDCDGCTDNDSEDEDVDITFSYGLN